MKVQNVKIGLRIPSKLFDKLNKDAEKDGVSMSAYARKLLEKHYGN